MKSDLETVQYIYIQLIFQRNNIYYKPQNPLHFVKDKIQNSTKFWIKNVYPKEDKQKVISIRLKKEMT